MTSIPIQVNDLMADLASPLSDHVTHFGSPRTASRARQIGALRTACRVHRIDAPRKAYHVHRIDAPRAAFHVSGREMLFMARRS